MVPARRPARALSEMPVGKVTAGQVTCPKCQMTYPITPEVYGAIAECSECLAEFMIGWPGPSGAAPDAGAGPGAKA